MNLVIFSLSLTMLLGFSGYAVDTGMIWVERTRLQHSVDAAVLAAAQELPASDSTTRTAARNVACDFSTVRNAVVGMAGKTGSCLSKADVTFPDANTIRVTAYRTVVPKFGHLLGMQPQEVWAQATARIGSLGAACIFPFFLTENQITSSTAFYGPVKFTSANTAGGAIRVGDGGAGAIKAAMTSTACTANPPLSFEGTVGDTVITKPGDLTQFRQGWWDIRDAAPSSACPNLDVSTYLVLDASGQYKLDPAITRQNCPRLHVIPVLANGNYGGGEASGKIVGFIPFYFARICDASTCSDSVVETMNRNEFWGYYVRLDLTSLKYSDYKPEYGTKVVSLAP